MRKNIFIFLSIFFISQAFTFKNLKYDDSLLLRMPPKTAGRLYEALKVIDHVFQKNNILYWIDGGTLLGAIRHKGIIPWDKDADIEFLSDNVEKVWNLRDEFRKFGFILKIGPFGNNYKLCSLGSQNIVDVDILPVKYFPNKGVCQIVDKDGDVLYDYNWFYLKEINDIYRIQFGPIKLNCPGNPERYLHSYYSTCWIDMIRGYVDQHAYYELFYSKSNKYKLPVNPMPRVIKCKDFSSAKYERVDLRINLDDNPIDESLFNK